MGSGGTDIIWDEWNRGFTPKYPHNSVVQFTFRKFRDRLKENSHLRALDIGCGSGVHTTFLAREGFNTSAIDTSLIAVKNTLLRLKDERLEATVEVGSVLDIKHPTDFFDFVISVSVLDVIPKKHFKDSIREISRILKPTGYAFLFFAAPNDFRLEKNLNLGLRGISSEEIDDAMRDLRGKHQHYKDLFSQTQSEANSIQVNNILTFAPRL